MALHRKQLVVLDVIHDDLPSEIASLPLDAGEKEAIYLATRVPNSLVLLDDSKAREEAKARKLAVKDTKGNGSGLPERSGDPGRDGDHI